MTNTVTTSNNNPVDTACMKESEGGDTVAVSTEPTSPTSTPSATTEQINQPLRRPWFSRFRLVPPLISSSSSLEAGYNESCNANENASAAAAAAAVVDKEGTYPEPGHDDILVVNNTEVTDDNPDDIVDNELLRRQKLDQQEYERHQQRIDLLLQAAETSTLSNYRPDRISLTTTHCPATALTTTTNNKPGDLQDGSGLSTPSATQIKRRLQQILGATLSHDSALQVIRIASLNVIDEMGGLFVIRQLPPPPSNTMNGSENYDEDNAVNNNEKPRSTDQDQPQQERQQLVLQVGDVLESINNFRCHQMPLDAVEDYLSQEIVLSMTKGVVLSFVFSTFHNQKHDRILVDEVEKERVGEEHHQSQEIVAPKTSSQSPQSADVLFQSIILPPDLLWRPPSQPIYRDGNKQQQPGETIITFHQQDLGLGSPAKPLSPSDNGDNDDHAGDDDDDDDDDDANATEKSTVDNDDSLPPSYLQIRNISIPSNWPTPLSSNCGSVLAVQEGHYVIAMNDNACFALTPASAQQLLEELLSPTFHQVTDTDDEDEGNDDGSVTTKVTMHPFVSLMTLAAPLPLPLVASAETPTTPLTWKERARQASMVTAGGTLTAVGAALMVTPMHPVGHLMAMGGVAILGREFKMNHQQQDSDPDQQQRQEEGTEKEKDRVEDSNDTDASVDVGDGSGDGNASGATGDGSDDGNSDAATSDAKSNGSAKDESDKGHQDKAVDSSDNDCSSAI